MRDTAKARLLVELIRQTSTKAAIQEFLKEKGVPFSGTWDDVRDKRVLGALEDEKFDVDDLIPILRAAEEHGSQHVFLYKCDPDVAAKLMDRGRVEAELRRRGESEVLSSPRILEQPLEPTITDVRWLSANIDLALVIKEVETRESQHPLEEIRSLDGTRLTKTYAIKKERAVNVARLLRTGELEIRVSARTTGSTKYTRDVDVFWSRMRELLPKDSFSPIKLTTLKARVVGDRGSLESVIRFSNSNLKNEMGAAMSVSSRGADASLYGDPGAERGIQAFLDEDGYCESSNFFFKNNASLSRDLHILLTGAENEFAITSDCSETDYEYVLTQVRSLNSRVSGGAEVTAIAAAAS